MFDKLGQHLAQLRSSARNGNAETGQLNHAPAPTKDEQERNLFVIFEKEFARPLSPMECETISVWVDQDGYPDELILLALKEAVFAGKVHFRYIDRILLEWSRNRVKTVEDAKAYIQRFRGGMR
ncbi:DNA replication protein DnaD [compost metagenome]